MPSPVCAETGTIACEVAPLPRLLDERQQFRLGDQIDLVEDEHDRRLRLLEQAGDELVAVPRARRGVEHQHDNVDFPQGLDGGVHHPDVQSMQGPMDARRIDEHDLAVRIILHAQDAPARRLRLVGDDRDLGADEGVEQRGLAGVGPPDQGHVTGLHRIDCTSGRAMRSMQEPAVLRFIDRSPEADDMNIFVAYFHHINFFVSHHDALA